MPTLITIITIFTACLSAPVEFSFHYPAAQRAGGCGTALAGTEEPAGGSAGIPSAAGPSFRPSLACLTDSLMYSVNRGRLRGSPPSVAHRR